MKIKKLDLLIIIIPVVIMLLLYPVLPERVPLQWGLNGSVHRSIDKHFSFVIGLLPFIIYKSYQYKNKRG